MITASGRHEESDPNMTTGTELAGTPAGTDATPEKVIDTTTTVSTTDDDGIMDLDAMADAQANAGDIEDGSLEGDDPEKDKLAVAPAETETEDEKAKKLSGAQRSKIERQRLIDQIAERDRELETLRTRGTAVTKALEAGVTDPDMPKEADFNGDYFAFQNAVGAYTAAKAAREATESVLRSREEAEVTKRNAERQRVIDLDHLERVETAKEIITDFDTVMEGMKGVNVSDSLIDLIKASENSAVISYRLAQDPELLTRIDRMTPLQQAKEIGRLEVTEKLPERKTVTKADPPLSKSKGAAPAVKSQEQQLSSWLDKKYPNRKK